MYRSQKIIVFLLIVYLIVGSVAIYKLWKHACMHSLSAFVAVMIFGFGVIIYRMLRGTQTRIVKYTHATIHVIATTILLVGILTAATPTGNDGVHELPAIVVIIALFIQFFVALVVFTYLYGYKRLRLYFAPFHDIIGIWLFICLIGVCVAGIYSEFAFEEDLDITSRYQFVVLAYATGIIIVIIVLSPYFEWELVK